MDVFFFCMTQFLNSTHPPVYHMKRYPEEDGTYPELTIERGGITCTLNVFLDVTANITGELPFSLPSQVLEVDVTRYEIILTHLFELIDVHALFALLMEFFGENDITIHWGNIKSDIPAKYVQWYNNCEFPFALFYIKETAQHQVHIAKPFLGQFSRALFVNSSKEKADVIYDAVSKALSARVKRARQEVKKYNAYIQKE